METVFYKLKHLTFNILLYTCMHLYIHEMLYYLSIYLYIYIYIYIYIDIDIDIYRYSIDLPTWLLAVLDCSILY
jgi:hypothetical protein